MATGTMTGKRAMLDWFTALENGGRPLSPFQRVLLMTDGTVTDVLEVYVGEIIRVVVLDQCLTQPPLGTLLAGVGRPEPLLQRSIVLRGSESGTVFIYADATIAVDRLDPSLLHGLLDGAEPIGRLLARDRIETFREIIEFGTEPAGAYGHHFAVEGSSTLLFRTYQIVVDRRPLMRITERFPKSWFVKP